jgi:hypothetical protein
VARSAAALLLIVVLVRLPISLEPEAKPQADVVDALVVLGQPAIRDMVEIGLDLPGLVDLIAERGRGEDQGQVSTLRRAAEVAWGSAHGAVTGLSATASSRRALSGLETVVQAPEARRFLYGEAMKRGGQPVVCILLGGTIFGPTRCRRASRTPPATTASPPRWAGGGLFERP